MTPLAQRALLGLARAPAGAVDDGLPDEIRALVADAPPDQALLWAAGALSVYRVAGYAPISIKKHDSACDGDVALHCSTRQTALLEALWDEPDLLALAGQRLARTGRVLSPALLPRALDLSPARRGAVAGVLGERGRWLAALRPRWSWAIATDEDDDALARTVEEGAARAPRAAALRTLRERDPARARALLAASWKGEQADTRAALLEGLEVGLGPEDEAVLEGALRDRARAVRRQAQTLLARLPGSAFAARMAARAAGLVIRREVQVQARQPGALQRLTRLFGARAAAALQTRLTLAPPAELPTDWREDGIEGPAPGAKPDTPTAWACQVLALVPPGVWLACPDLAEPGAALAQLPDDEPALWLALAEAVVAFSDRGLARPLGRWLLVGSEPGDREAEVAVARLTPLMVPPSEQEVLTLLQRSDGLVRARYAQTLGLIVRPWSTAVGRAFCDALFTWLSGGGRLDGSSDHPFLATAVEDAALALPEPFVTPLLNALNGVLASIPGPQRQRALDRFTTRLRLRARLITEIPCDDD